MRGGIVVIVEAERKARLYMEALSQLGVRGDEAMVFTPTDRPREVRAITARASGLLLCGGPDLDPARYGEQRCAEAGLALYPELDALEWEAVEGAESTAVPVWAICRGLQMINVYLGGDLWQDLQLQVPGALDHNPGGALDSLAHELCQVDAGSPFGARLAAGRVSVNSRHHQAIRRLAESLTPVAYSPDGVLEVAETRSGPWWLRGVQWHPENLLHLPVQRRLWQDFLDAVATHARPSAAAVAR